MPSDFIYPTSAELEEIAQDKLPRLIAERPVFRAMPITSVDAHLLEWEQEDNWTGLQQVRGLGGEPGRVKKVGLKRYQVLPGVYGEYVDIDEVELTSRRQYGTFGQPADISDLVMRGQDRLLQRRLDRVEYILWQLLSTGTFAVSGDAGVLHTDSYSVQTFSASTPWSTAATSTPLADFRAVQLDSRGHSVSFGAQALAFLNRVTFNELISNTNASDLYGRRQQGLATINNLNDVRSLLMGDDLPELVVYDEGYLNDSGTFVPFIANSKVVVVGRRPGGAPIGDYAMTRNANNPNLAPGPYMKVVDLGEEGRVPRRIDVHDGHNGGARLWFPSGVVIMNV